MTVAVEILGSHMTVAVAILGGLASLAALLAAVFATLRYIIRAEMRPLHERLVAHLDDEEDKLDHVVAGFEIIADHVNLPESHRVYRKAQGASA